MKNRHKYLIGKNRDTLCKHPSTQEGNLNYSRTVGSAGNWIGCGYIPRVHSYGNYYDIIFPYFSLVYVASGEGNYIDLEGNDYPLAAGSVFMRLPGISHTSTVVDADKWREYYLDCDQALFDQLVTQGFLNKSQPVYQQPPTEALTQRFEEMLGALRDAPEQAMPRLQARFLSLMADLTSEEDKEAQLTPMQKRIVKSCQDFDQLFANRLDLQAYCKEQGWHYEHFRKEFKKQMGISPRDYLIRRRMDHACRLLRSSPLRISQIADQLGYPSQYAFSNQFHQNFGVYPKHFRQGVKEEGGKEAMDVESSA